MFSVAVRKNGRFRKPPNRNAIVQSLNECVCVGIHNVRLEPTIFCLVIEADITGVRANREHIGSRNSSKIKVLHTELRILDINLAIRTGNNFRVVGDWAVDILQTYESLRSCISHRLLAWLNRDLPLRKRAVSFLGPVRTTFRFPCSSFGMVAYATKSVTLIDCSTWDGIFAGGG